VAAEVEAGDADGAANEYAATLCGDDAGDEACDVAEVVAS